MTSLSSLDQSDSAIHSSIDQFVEIPLPLNNPRFAKYINFLNNTLKPNLKLILDKRNEVYNEISEYDKLSKNISLIQSEQLAELNLSIPIGSDIYCQVNVPETHFIFVTIGLSFIVEMTLNEAIEFCQERVKLLNSKVQSLSVKAANISAQIKFVYEACGELVKIDERINQPKTQ